MSDTAYRIKAEREGSLIVSYTLVLEKARYLSPEELTISLKDNYEIGISQYAIADENTKVVLRVLVSVLRKEGELNQSEIFKRLKEKGFARRKVEPVLKEYCKKGLFTVRKGEKNSVIYSVNEDSEYIPILFHRELSQSKKSLLEFIDSLMKDEIREFPDEIVVNQFRFLTCGEVKKNIYRMSDEEAEELHRQLVSLFPDSPPSPEELEDF
jgi:predicted transcriptional regulator